MRRGRFTHSIAIRPLHGCRVQRLPHLSGDSRDFRPGRWLHLTGGLLVAETQDRWDFLRADCARQQMLGAATELVSPAQIRELCPIMDTSRVRGAIYDPREGHVESYGATHAYAKAARLNGAESMPHSRVEIVPSGKALGTLLRIRELSSASMS